MISDCDNRKTEIPKRLYRCMKQRVNISEGKNPETTVKNGGFC